MTTPLYPTFQKSINDSIEQLIKNQVTPWAFLNSGKPMRVKCHDGKNISYEGIGYEGSPEHVFWSRYIEPFIEELVVKKINEAVSLAKERNVDGKKLLKEIEGLLLAGTRKIYNEMANTDQRLRGREFPKKLQIRSIEREYQVMKELIELRVRAESEMWHSKSSLELWYERNKFIVWAVGILIAVVGTWAKLA